MDLQQGRAMSTDILYAMKPQLSTVPSNAARSNTDPAHVSSIRALSLAARVPIVPQRNKLSTTVLLLVIGAHAALFYLALTRPIDPTPMVTSASRSAVFST